MIVGNFSTYNPSKELMACGGWFLHHRTDEHLIALAQEAGVSRDCIFADKEPTGVNLFMHIKNI